MCHYAVFQLSIKAMNDKNRFCMVTCRSRLFAGVIHVCFDVGIVISYRLANGYESFDSQVNSLSYSTDST